MIEASVYPIAFGLAAAVAWGAGDFSGGLASRRMTVLAVTIWAELIGLIVLLALVISIGEPALSLQNWLLAAIGGISGGIGLLLLYQALANGQMSIAAPISAVLAAIIPVLVSAVALGLPGPLTLGGMLLGLLAIGLVAGGESRGQTRLSLAQIRLPLIAGVMFGLYFVLINRASVEALYWPLIAARLASVASLVGYALFTHQSWMPPKAHLGLVALCGLLDTGANWFYVLAGHHGRMDVAAVLGSLYPGVTALLAWIVLKERLNQTQLWGVAAAFAAIVLITL